jgi:hypothetical protein
MRLAPGRNAETSAESERIGHALSRPRRRTKIRCGSPQLAPNCSLSLVKERDPENEVRNGTEDERPQHDLNEARSFSVVSVTLPAVQTDPDIDDNRPVLHCRTSLALLAARAHRRGEDHIGRVIPGVAPAEGREGVV